ncbi:ribonuclease HII [Porphyromonas sp. oral taxon 275]|uniref:ribonuclease HII n=1 Tax=Porphyromonas sp. oral taxon 275 TaxID=712435 RepID=UPI001BACCBB3|nr:ribonuclease HII [Porphyromonas sp. oral taxon 275]QUB42292.1 ribonuclease HII [Porphyromonas sp. oral taxon 275]
MAREGKERQALRAHFSPLGIMECGCDEAGRGCLAGPVVAAAVILPKRFAHPLLNDSKQLTETQRELLRPIIEAEALSWGIGVCSPEEIDQMNILQASITAMHRAIDQLVLSPELLLIDGNRFRPYPGIPHECIVKGDATYRSIAAASILAKTERDRLMLELEEQYPGYGFAEHKGYPTPQHRAALAELGPSPVHRLSFRLL